MEPSHSLRSFLLGTAIPALLASPVAFAGNTWDGGGGSGLWSNNTNWNLDTAPSTGVALTFAGNTQNSTSNNLAAVDPSFAGILFTNSGAASNTNAFTLAGSRITLGGDITTTANTAGTTITDIISLNMILSGNRIITTNQQSATVQHNLTISGNISEDVAGRTLTKNGDGTLVLSGANAYSGSTTINLGALRITNSAALGTIAGGTAVTATGAALEIDGSGGDLNLGTEAITIVSGGISNNGAIRNIAGNNTLGGVVTLTGVSRIVSDAGTLTLTNNVTGTGPGYGLIMSGEGNITISGNITTGASNLVKNTGNGTVTLSGTNNYTGLTRIFGGTLSVATIGNGGVAGNMGAASNAAANLDFQGGTLRYTGVTASTDRAFTVVAAGTASIEITEGTTNLTMSGGSAATTGGLTKTGAGTLTFSGANLYTGATSVTAGKLIINGSTTSTSLVTVNSGATLGGSGTVGGNTTISGIHSPGTSPGIQTFSGNLGYTTGSSLTWELTSDAIGLRGTDYDGVNVGGNLDFAGATTINLVFNLAGSTVNWNDTFWDTNRTGTSGWLIYDVAGTTTNFSNLSITAANWLDGSGQNFNTFNSGSTFSIFQNGNDIYLTYTAVPEPSASLLGGLGLLALMRRRRN